MIYFSKAIVIKICDARECDRFYTLLTCDCGKVEAVGAGVKKAKSKLGPHLSLFALCDCMFAKGRYYDRLTGAALVNYPLLAF